MSQFQLVLQKEELQDLYRSRQDHDFKIQRLKSLRQQIADAQKELISRSQQAQKLANDSKSAYQKRQHENIYQAIILREEKLVQKFKEESQKNDLIEAFLHKIKHLPGLEESTPHDWHHYLIDRLSARDRLKEMYSMLARVGEAPVRQMFKELEELLSHKDQYQKRIEQLYQRNN